MNRLLHFFIYSIITFAAFAAEYAPADVPNVQLSDSTQLVSDPDGYLDAASVDHINANLRAIRSLTTSEPVVVVIGEMPSDYDIDTYATELFELWGLGKKDRDNGLLILVAVEDHDFVIRTGRGMEGPLPDVICGRIGRNIIVPAFRQEQYGQGLAEATDKIREVVSDPAVRDELMSAEGNNYGNRGDDFSWADILGIYFTFAIFATIAMALVLYFKLKDKKVRTRYDKYMAARTLKDVTGISSIFLLGLPLIIYLPLRAAMHRWRDGEHLCPNCKSRMTKMDEVHDNDYLTPAQDAEERFNSVDYDVWVCPTCNEVDIYPFDNPQSSLTVCPTCGARTERMVRDRVLVQPTDRREGQGVKEYECLHCHTRRNAPYRIAKTAAAVGPIIGGGGFGSGSSGGGFGGGGFGGGMTGGGGFSGKW